MKMRVRKKVKKIVITVFLFSFFLLPDAQAANSDIIQIGVVKFDSKAPGVKDDQAEIISDLFGRTFANSSRIALLERERLDRIAREIRLNLSGLVAPDLAAQVGRLAGCQYMLLGSVTELRKETTSIVIPLSVNLPSFDRGGRRGNGIASIKEVAKVTIDTRIIDTATSEVVSAFSGIGIATDSRSAISIGGFNHVEAALGELESRAIADAVNRITHRIRSDIAKEYAYVVSAEDPNRINIDVGSSLGVQPGVLYLVYQEGSYVTDMDGRILGRNKDPIAALAVSTTEPEFSTCKATKETNGKLVQRGDRVDPITAETYRQMLKQNIFPKERPKKRAYDDTAEQIFSNSGVS